MTSKSLEEYIGSIGERSETPGGGSVSAAVASMVLKFDRINIYKKNYVLSLFFS